MSRKEKKFEKMQVNPRNDWSIEDLKAVAKEFGVEVRNPRGSHVVFSHSSHPDNLTIPARKPLKPFYVEQFTAFIERIKTKQ